MKNTTLLIGALIIAIALLASSCSLPGHCPSAYRSYQPKSKGAIHHYKPTAKKY